MYQDQMLQDLVSNIEPQAWLLYCSKNQHQVPLSKCMHLGVSVYVYVYA